MLLNRALQEVFVSPRIVLLDLEYTCWEGSLETNWKRRGEHREIVQIASLMIDTTNLRECSYFNQLVRPQLNPVLSDYFINLTGISNEDIQDRGGALSIVLEAWFRFVGDAPIYSWGDETPVFAENLRLLGQEHMVMPSIIDLRPIVLEVAPQTRCATSGELASIFGSNVSYRAHDALEDCRSIAEALRCLVA